MWLRRRAEKDPAPDLALKEAQESLKQIEARSCEVSHISTVVRHLREKNHFSEQLAAIMETPR